MSSKEKNVHIGEVKIGRRDDVLRALLGSCVGIALLWPKKGIYGLAHCLLAKSPEESFSIDGRYVDQAIKSLFALMHIKKENIQEIEAIVAGGGNMTMPDKEGSEKLVGVENTKMALKCLNELKVNIAHQDTGGLEGRKIIIQCSTGQFEIKKIPKTNAA